jgi:hypothetical protein
MDTYINARVSDRRAHSLMDHFAVTLIAMRIESEVQLQFHY